MSFFAQLLAGAASGVGKGMVDQADYNDKLAAQQALLQEKQANALQLQEQKANERLFQAQTIAALKGSGGGGSVDVFSRLRSAKPEDQRMALGEIRALGGDDAANLAEESILGRAPMRQRPADFVGLPGQSDIGPDAKITERVEYDKIKGQQALNRVYALIAGKGDTKGNAEAEDKYISNDLRAAGLEEAIGKGKPLDQASEYASKVADPATYNKDLTNAERVRASERNADKRVTATNDAADLRHKAGQIRDLEKQVIDLIKITGDRSRYNKEAMKEAQDMLPLKRAELAALKGAEKPAASTSQSSTWTQTGNTAPKLQDSLARFSAMRQGQAAR